MPREVLEPYMLNPNSPVSQAIHPDSGSSTNSRASSFYSHLHSFEWTGCEPHSCGGFVFVIKRMSFLTKLVTPLQAVIAVGVVMALSYRHIDEYNRHVEKYGPLGSMPRKRFAVEGPAPRRLEESPAPPEEGRLEWFIRSMGEVGLPACTKFLDEIAGVVHLPWFSSFVIVSRLVFGIASNFDQFWAWLNWVRRIFSEVQWHSDRQQFSYGIPTINEPWCLFKLHLFRFFWRTSQIFDRRRSSVPWINMYTVYMNHKLGV